MQQQHPAPEASPHDHAITEREAAQILKVSRPTIQRRLNDKSLPSFTIGRCRRIWLSDLRAFAAGNPK